MTIYEQYEAAQLKLNELRSARADFVSKAEYEAYQKINADADFRYAAEIQSAAEEFNTAKTAWLAIKNVPHPIGTKYLRWEKDLRWRGFGRPIHEPRKWIATGETAVLEVVTRESKFADNLSRYSRPKVGEIILRVNKKNGEPGLRFIASAYFVRSEWRVPQWYPEGEDPNQVEESPQKAEEKQKA